jgi:DNA-binding response OmpR family regulator
VVTASKRTVLETKLKGRKVTIATTEEERKMPNKTILVVEDSPTDMRLMTAPLREKGYQVVTAVDGEEALDKVAHERPDLIILDIILPKKNGFQVCRQLKTSPDTKDIKIVMLTSKSQDSDRFWGLKQGADEYMTKPFEDDALLANVAKLL